MRALGNRKTGTSDILVIDTEKEGHFDLIKRAYDEIYIPSFPDKQDREPLSRWVNRCDPFLQKNNTSAYILMVAGQNLADPENGFIEGLAVGIYFKRTNVALLAYNAVREECRGSGLGKMLLNARLDYFDQISKKLGRPTEGIFLEVENPDFDGLTREKRKICERRIETYRRWGAQELPLDYAHPPLVASDDFKLKEYKLLSFPGVNNLNPSTRTIKHFLACVYMDCGILCPTKDPDFKEMLKQLNVMNAKPQEQAVKTAFERATKAVKPKKAIANSRVSVDLDSVPANVILNPALC